MKYKHIIWDWNGTLLDDCQLCVKSFNRSLKKRDLKTISLDKYRSIFTFPVIDAYIKAGFDFKKESFIEVSNEFVEFYEKNFKNISLHNNVKEILKKISLQDATQSILSAGNQDLLNNWLKQHQIIKIFQNVVGVQNQFANGKIEQGLKLIENLKFNKKDIVLIGDTIHDSEVAEKMDIECILVNHGHVNNTRLKKTGRRVVSNIKKIFELIN